jgi:hypothetical protein
MGIVDEQIAEIMARVREAGMDVSSPAYRTAEQWRTFFEAPIDGKFFIVTNFIFNKDPVAGIGGTAAVSKIRARQDALGMKYLADGVVVGTINGPADAIPWQTCGVVEVPNKEAYLTFFLEDLEMQKKRADYINLYRAVLVKKDMRMA